MAVAIGTVVLLAVWLVFIFSARNPDRGQREAEHNQLRTTEGTRPECLGPG